MTKELEEWLRYHWRIDNHPRYQHYFDEWFVKLLPTQIEYFKKQMYNEKNGVLGKTMSNKK